MKKIFNNVNPPKLVDEFLVANIDIDISKLTTNDEENSLSVVFSDGVDMQLVTQIIDTHDPTPIPSAPTQDDFLLDLELRLTMLELGL